MEPIINILEYSSEHRSAIRRILTKVGWAGQYISGMETALDVFSKDTQTYGIYLALANGIAVGYLYVQYSAWNQLCQIQGLAVDPQFQRQGIASALVARAEQFAKFKKARGIYVDTPTSNTGGRAFYESIGYQLGYIMPRYYEDGLDGVTYQKFFKGNELE